MNNLNAQQVILVALLVAIVTSITTGIVIFSLSDQSGGNVSQTIYRVVEKTIAAATTPDSPVRNIVPSKPDTTPSAPAQVPLSTIAATAGKNLIRIYTVEQGNGQKTFVTLAVSLGSKGLLIGADLGTSGTVIAEGSNLIAVTADGQEVPVTLKKQAFLGPMPLFAISNDSDQSKITPSSLTNFKSLKLGTNVIAFGGKETDDVVSTGIVSEFTGSGNVTGDDADVAVTDMMLSSRMAGFELLDTGGNVTGLSYAFEEGKPAKYISIDEVKKLSESI